VQGGLWRGGLRIRLFGEGWGVRIMRMFLLFLDLVLGFFFLLSW